jgi:hypothetical protein
MKYVPDAGRAMRRTAREVKAAGSILPTNATIPPGRVKNIPRFAVIIIHAFTGSQFNNA